MSDLDGDGIPDLIDGDIDQDGYLNAIEEIYGTDSMISTQVRRTRQ